MTGAEGPHPGRRGWPTPTAPAALSPDDVGAAMVAAIADGELDAWLARIHLAAVARMSTPAWTYPTAPR